MRPEDQFRLRHLTEAASKQLAYCARRRGKTFDTDELLRLAVPSLSKSSAKPPKQISPELQAANLVSRGRRRPACVTASSTTTSDVNLDILWETVTDDLPRLLETCTG